MKKRKFSDEQIVKILAKVDKTTVAGVNTGGKLDIFGGVADAR